MNEIVITNFFSDMIKNYIIWWNVNKRRFRIAIISYHHVIYIAKIHKVKFISIWTYKN